jgi:hypothetical protein
MIIRRLNYSVFLKSGIIDRLSAGCLAIILIAGLYVSAMQSQTRSQTGVLVPVEAELLMHLEASHLKTGGSVFARVSVDWTGPGCVLRRGATLEATVVAVTPHSPISSGSEVALSFEKAQCGKSDMEPFALLLAAIAAPGDEENGSITTDLPAALGGSSIPGTSGPATTTANSLRSVDQQVDPMLINVHRFPATASLRAGDVLGIKGLKLSVATGPESSSVLSSKGHDVELYQHTRLLLMPSSAMNTKAQSSAQPQTAALPQQASERGRTDLVVRLVSATPERAAEEDLDTCAPPECTIASDEREGATDARAAGSISIASLGYAPRSQIEIDAPGQDEALAYLGPTELLVAFNPHSLVPRHGDVAAGSTVRVIRAALVDVVNQKVVRTVDWRLPDRKQFLWTLAQYRVLVHVGNELRVYGPGLKVEQHIGLSGPLAFVRASPDGKVVAIGTIKERHSEELHHKLRESLGQEPDEDVEIVILNQKFETIATTTSTSDRLPPTLLNEGQLKLLQQSGQAGLPDRRYHLTLRTWDNLSRSLGRFTSTCIPEVSSLAPDLVFLVTCDSANQAREYRVMRPDGRPVLRGKSMLRELGHAAIGDENTKEFAVKIFQADQPVLPGEMFHPANLQSVELGVYRSESGRQLFSVRISDPAASAGGYAMAPGGGQLAVLTRDRIELYAFPRDVK